MPDGKPTHLYAVFHLNLAFSSIEASAHAEVVRQCYWPLLEQIDAAGVPLGLELTLYTLECIQRVDPDWIARFRTLLAAGRCELIASGDSQIIGPLVPAEVNRWNLQLGQKGYRTLLGVTPSLAYINEQAVSAGLLDIYREAGFEAVIIEWDNPYSHHPDWDRQTLNRPRTLRCASGETIKVIWNHAVAFQKFQRYAYDETTLEDYLDSLHTLIGPDCHCFPLYGSDAEVFDYRPGRYQVESAQQHHEWQRLTLLFQALQQATIHNRAQYRLVPPSQALSHWRDEPALDIGTARHPISVKKQAKYNITRWALSGRNDLWLNSLCFQRYQQLTAEGSQDHAEWTALCRLWASDLRTHLTANRYQALAGQWPLHPDAEAADADDFTEGESGVPPGYSVVLDEARQTLTVASEQLRAVFNIKRGMSLISLAFASQQFEPLLGTLFHGHFDHIGYSADFYSNHLVMERFRERDRVTDLGRVSWQLQQQAGDLLIQCCLNTPQGVLHKHYRLHGESLACRFQFAQGERPEASLRLGYVTLLDCQQRPWFASYNGGDREEFFQVTEDLDHGAPVSSIVSAGAALGATTGECRFGSGQRGVVLRWNPAQCAALPLVSSLAAGGQYLNRLCFSLVEADETLKAGGYLPGFTYTMAPCVT